MGCSCDVTNIQTCTVWMALDFLVRIKLISAYLLMHSLRTPRDGAHIQSWNRELSVRCHTMPEALNYFAKLFRVVLAELASTIGIVSLGWDIFIVKTLEMSQGRAEHGLSLFEDLKHAQHVT